MIAGGGSEEEESGSLYTAPVQTKELLRLIVWIEQKELRTNGNREHAPLGRNKSNQNIIWLGALICFQKLKQACSC